MTEETVTLRAVAEAEIVASETPDATVVSPTEPNRPSAGPEFPPEGKAQNVSRADAILCTALDVGEGMLRCGGEVHRTEDTIERICRAYGAVHVEVFSIISLIIAAIRLPDGSYSSQVRRVYSTDNHFRRLEALNELSREICAHPPELDSVQRRLREIKAMRENPLLPYLGAILAAGGFAVFFGGNWYDGIAAAVIGVIVTLLRMHFPKFLNSLGQTVICSFLGGTLAEFLPRVTGFGFHKDKIMIGMIMLVIPGLAFGNAFRDLLCGDLIAGLMRLIQAILTAAVIAFSFSAAMFLFGGAV